MLVLLSSLALMYQHSFPSFYYSLCVMSSPCATDTDATIVYEIAHLADSAVPSFSLYSLRDLSPADFKSSPPSLNTVYCAVYNLPTSLPAGISKAGFTWRFISTEWTWILYPIPCWFHLFSASHSLELKFYRSVLTPQNFTTRFSKLWFRKQRLVLSILDAETFIWPLRHRLAPLKWS